MGERKTVFILAPSDVKPGSIDPDGRIVKTATMYVSKKGIVVGVEFEDGTSASYLWPNGSGWTVNGRTAP